MTCTRSVAGLIVVTLVGVTIWAIVGYSEAPRIRNAKARRPMANLRKDVMALALLVEADVDLGRAAGGNGGKDNAGAAREIERDHLAADGCGCVVGLLPDRIRGGRSCGRRAVVDREPATGRARIDDRDLADAPWRRLDDLRGREVQGRRVAPACDLVDAVGVLRTDAIAGNRGLRTERTDAGCHD